MLAAVIALTAISTLAVLAAIGYRSDRNRARRERDAWMEIAAARSATHSAELYFVANREDECAKLARRAETEFTRQVAEVAGATVTGAGNTGRMC